MSGASMDDDTTTTIVFARPALIDTVQAGARDCGIRATWQRSCRSVGHGCIKRRRLG